MITKERALEALENLDDYARMQVSIEPIGSYNSLKEFIEQSSKIKEALESFLNCHEECLDFDGWVAFMVSADDYHRTAGILGGNIEDESETGG